MPGDDGGGPGAQCIDLGALDIAKMTPLPEIDIEELLTFIDTKGDGQNKDEGMRDHLKHKNGFTMGNGSAAFVMHTQ